MGCSVKEALAKDNGFSLAFEVDKRFTVEVIKNRSDGGPLLAASLLDLESSCDTLGLTPGAICDVLVDFTNADSLLEAAMWCTKNGIHLVSGSTGLSKDKIEEIEKLFSDPKSPNCVLAANFSVSAVVLMQLAKIAAPYFDSVEIIELHHDEKKDAPSGTAIATAEHIAEALGENGLSLLRKDPTETERIAGSRGAETVDGIRIHSVRLHGLVAHEEVLFGSEGQSLTLRQDSYNRTSFMPGVLLAIREVPTRSGMTIGLEKLLGFDK